MVVSIMVEQHQEEMSLLRKALKAIVPPLTYHTHKGALGRIGVIGGSLEYTGAPYFAAISAMKGGADLGHVFCHEDAALAIKAYSPELIVHPLLSDKPSAAESVVSWLPRLHSLVIGPGLGRDPMILSLVKDIISEAKLQQKYLVIDADGLHLVINEPEVITGYSRVILTPNGGEFPRLHEKVCGKGSSGGDDKEIVKSLAAKMGGVTIVKKGKIDIISNGSKVIECKEKGCPRRCGGQGDVLSGITGLFSYWAAEQEQQLDSEFGLSPTIVAAYGGCFVTKKCAEAAFAKHHRSMLAHNLVDKISSTFVNYIEP